MEQYIVTGMSCAACQARVEKAVNGVPGVTSCSVSLLTNSMGVEGTASASEIIKAVEDAGYGASVKGADKKADKLAREEDALKDRESPVLKKRLIYSLGFLAVLMYLSMGHKMAGFPVPGFLEGNPVSLSICEMLLAIIVMIINRKFFTSGFSSLMHGAPNMDTLVAMGSAASFVYSLAELFMMSDAMMKGNMEMAHHYHHNLYFESAAMIVALITVGKLLEAISKGRTTNALKSLLKLAPQKATLIINGIEKEVGIEEVSVGDIFAVRPGESVPVDGVIVEGNTAINESALTGESIPVDKSEGDLVSAATINQAGYFRARATRVGEDTTLSQIIQMVSDASATKAPIARIADKVSGIFVPAVIIIAIITLVVWLLAGQPFSFAIARAISVLVISCPCALGLATPVAIMVGNGVGAKNGILFKNAEALEQAGKTEIVVLDKTGTITTGQPKVTDIIAVNGHGEDELLPLANDLERKSEHPLARAITEYCDEKGIAITEVSDFQALPGNGVSAIRNGKTLVGGSGKFMKKHVGFTEEVNRLYDRLAEEGKTPLFFAQDRELVGMIAVADTIKEESAKAIKQLHDMGIATVMLTGDNEKTARAIGKLAGVDNVVAQVLPDGKEKVIRKLQESGKVAMVGDGINDALALTSADLGIAIGAGSDVAIDAADIVLMKSSLLDVPAAIRLSRNTLTNIHENLFWAFFYNVICIPLAAGLYSALFKVSWQMTPMLGAAAMSLSSFTVCTNALRLNLKNIYDRSHDRKNEKEIRIEDIILKEEEKMTKTIKIEGMMCEHCEATVKKALLKIDGVSDAVVSHVAGTAVVTLEKDVDNAVLKEAVEDRDYEVLGIE
ncbi:MAG: heavy metal translocating P-type ATPase [Erysipelotrichaceae bacterium]|nr:heavy metal translocating P-type ATPase [Erysipelotrichaceae bacterium]MBQ1523195.1 heavy metal translocating P-type ATPase [Erysipelotrichaceae bacterium]